MTTRNVYFKSVLMIVAALGLTGCRAFIDGSSQTFETPKAKVATELTYEYRALKLAVRTLNGLHAAKIMSTADLKALEPSVLTMQNILNLASAKLNSIPDDAQTTEQAQATFDEIKTDLNVFNRILRVLDATLKAHEDRSIDNERDHDPSNGTPSGDRNRGSPRPDPPLEVQRARLASDG